MRRFCIHVRFTDVEGVERFHSIPFFASDIVDGRITARVLVALLCSSPTVKEINMYDLESLKTD